MITKEEFEKAVEYCASDTTDCDGCPLCASDKQRVCSTYLAEYITKNEPALSANSTSSTKKENTFQIDDSTKAAICQAYDTVDEACTDIIDIYEGMSACERRAFDVGEVYGKICSTRDKLENMRGEN